MQLTKDLVAASATPLVLGILAEGESYGYAILKGINELSGSELTWTDGMLYPLLHRLDRLGLVEASWRTPAGERRRKCYRLTDAGQAALDEERTRWALVAETLQRGLAPPSPTDRDRRPDGRPRVGPSMTAPTLSDDGYDLESEIGQFRSYALRRPGVTDTDVDELEDHLRHQIGELTTAGLRTDEAFLIAVKRVGDLDDLSREFAREHSERLWTQLVLGGDAGHDDVTDWQELAVVVGAAVAAAVAVKVPELLGLPLDDPATGGFYARNLSFFVLPFLAAFFAWKRSLGTPVVTVVAVSFAAAAVVVNAYPWREPGHTEVLTALHLPIVLWAVVGLAYVGGEWRSSSRRMDFLRFSGEWFIYYSLLGLGGLVLMWVTAGVFSAIGIDTGTVVAEWLLPCGMAGAVLVAAWLVEAKQGVIENMAPVLTRVFTPMFTLLFASFLVTLVATRTWIDVERDVLILFDLVLVVVLGLLLYSLSARPPDQAPGIADWLNVSLLVGALAIDLLGLAAILGRITEFGFSANKTAALGENLVLLVNLGWAAWLYGRFVAGREQFATLVRWQTTYLPVVAIWAAAVVVVFPPLFGFE